MATNLNILETLQEIDSLVNLKMSKYLSAFAFITIIWSNDYHIMGSGLELDDIQDFEIVIENLSKDAIKLGLTSNHFEYIIINSLIENGTASNTKKSSQTLFIDIEINAASKTPKTSD